MAEIHDIYDNVSLGKNIGENVRWTRIHLCPFTTWLSAGSDLAVLSRTVFYKFIGPHILKIVFSGSSRHFSCTIVYRCTTVRMQNYLFLCIQSV